MAERILYTPKEVADMLGVSIQTFHGEVKQGNIQFILVSVYPA